MERRGPVVAVLLLAIGLPFMMPEHFVPGAVWVDPVILSLTVIGMFVVNPGRMDRRSGQAHYARLAVVAALIVGAAVGVAVLTHDLIYGKNVITKSGPSLLRAGALVWVGLVISFAFLYWELDLGGPGERAHRERRYPDMAFPEDLSAELHRPGWQPTFVDYLYVAVTNGLAFSPTDVMPIAHWAKLAMAAQSIASLAILGLVVSRAVNIFQ